VPRKRQGLHHRHCLVLAASKPPRDRRLARAGNDNTRSQTGHARPGWHRGGGVHWERDRTDDALGAIDQQQKLPLCGLANEVEHAVDWRMNVFPAAGLHMYLAAQIAQPQLADDLGKIAPTLSGAQQMQANDSITALNRDVQQFEDALSAMDQSSMASAARVHAQKDMKGPREVIDTLRHEASIWSFSAVGIFDAGRLWPDPHGTRYAIGAGGRLKLTKRISLNAEYYYMINPKNNFSQQVYNPLTVGVDIETGGHVFQLFFTNSLGTIEKQFIGETTGQWKKGDIHFGFNISRVFTLKKHQAASVY